MFRPLVLVILIAVVPDLTHGLKKKAISQPLFGKVMGKLISKETRGLLYETETVGSYAAGCANSISQRTQSCSKCVLSTLTCHGWKAFLKAVKAYADLNLESKFIDVAEKGVEIVTDEIASGSVALYKKYGRGALDALADEFNVLGGKFQQIGTQIHDALKQTISVGERALHEAESLAKAIWNPVKEGLGKVFGKRRRRGYLRKPEYYMKELTDDERSCASNCPSCTDFLHSDPLDTVRALCGGSHVNRLEDMYNTANQAQELASRWTSTAKNRRDFLSEIWIDERTMGLAKIKFWRSWDYGTYDVSNLHIPANEGYDEELYKRIADYIMNTY